jgi:hypothetical protein
MDVKELIKPTKQKIYTFILLIIGLDIFPKLITFLSTVFIARRLGAERFGDFVIFERTNIPYILITTVIYFLWVYLIVSIIVNINKKISLQKS